MISLGRRLNTCLPPSDGKQDGSIDVSTCIRTAFDTNITVMKIDEEN